MRRGRGSPNMKEKKKKEKGREEGYACRDLAIYETAIRSIQRSALAQHSSFSSVFVSAALSYTLV
jgi:hypothetical protein